MKKLYRILALALFISLAAVRATNALEPEPEPAATATTPAHGSQTH